MRETTTALTELRISHQYTHTQVEELKVKRVKENIDDLQKMLDFEDTRSTTKKINQDAEICDSMAFLKLTARHGS